MAGLFDREARRKGRGGGRGGGGRQGASRSGFSLPPFLSYDPAIGAEIRGLGRGLKDVLKDTRRGQRIRREDLSQRLADIATERARGTQEIGFKREDILQNQERGN